MGVAGADGMADGHCAMPKGLGALHAPRPGRRRVGRRRSCIRGGGAADGAHGRAATSRLESDLAAGVEAVLHATRSEEHTSELQSLMRISYAVFCLKKKKKKHH